MRRVDWNQLQRKKKMEQLSLEKDQRRPRRKGSDACASADEPMRRIDFERMQRAAKRDQLNSISTVTKGKSDRMRDRSRTIQPENNMGRPQKPHGREVNAKAMPSTAPLAPSWNGWFEENSNPDQETNSQATPYSSPPIPNSNAWFHGNASLDVGPVPDHIPQTLDPDPLRMGNMEMGQSSRAHPTPGFDVPFPHPSTTWLGTREWMCRQTGEEQTLPSSTSRTRSHADEYPGLGDCDVDALIRGMLQGDPTAPRAWSAGDAAIERQELQGRGNVP